MTVIAAIVTDGRAYMAADSRTSWGTCYRDDGRKLFRLGEVLVGFAGHSLFHRALATMPPCDTLEAEAWCGQLADHLIDYGKGRGHGEVTNAASMQSFTLLAATTAGLWEVSGDGSVLRVADGYTAIGSGGAEARGALHVLRRGDEPVERLHSAIAAAIALDRSCGGPVHVLETP